MKVHKNQEKSFDKEPCGTFEKLIGQTFGKIYITLKLWRDKLKSRHVYGQELKYLVGLTRVKILRLKIILDLVTSLMAPCVLIEI